MEIVKSGACVADSFNGEEIDFREWQYYRRDPNMKVELSGGSLRIYGQTSQKRRFFTGLGSHRLYPPDAMLLTEIRIPCSLEQPGTYGFVTHLCNRLGGVEVKAPAIPDNNSEIAFGRRGDKVGWFHWWFDQTGERFHKWVEDEDPLPPFGDEAKVYHTMRVAYDAPTRSNMVAVWHDNRWLPVGVPRHFLKIFSSIELKIDAQVPGLDLEVRFRNCRLFPHPARHPVRVFVGDPKPMVGAKVQLLELKDKGVVAEGEANEDGLVFLTLPVDGMFPMSGRFVVQHSGKVVDELIVEAHGVQGIYPGDLYGTPGGWSGNGMGRVVRAPSQPTERT